jgi:ubiquitin-protein ligase
MIDFACSGCGKRYSVKDDLAGRSTRCRVCQTSLRVPSPTAATPRGRNDLSPSSITPLQNSNPPPLPTPKPPPRVRRLLADDNQMRRAFQNHPLIRIISVEGSPADHYQIEYRVRGLVRGSENPVVSNRHVVAIQLTSEYPRQSPKCKILTPIFHPNFDPTTICVGDHWTAAERLVDLVIRIGEMIAYQVYNVRSPLDGQAAMWADLNQDRFPIDRRDLTPPHLE